LGDLPPSSTVREGREGIEESAVNFDYIDGKCVTTDLNPFANPTRPIMLSPGLHHLDIQTGFYETQFTARVNLRAEANHIYRLTGEKGHGYTSVLFWDETQGIEKRTLLGEIEVNAAASREYMSIRHYDKSRFPWIP
jgi:hypothetical protein